jgi:uncharacterized protein
MRSHLLEGTVRHRRARPFVYDLRHDVYYVALDLDELAEIGRSLRLVSRNGRNLYGLRDDDHLDPPADDLRARFLDHLRAEGVDPTGWQITLVTNLRVLGFVFNPASFYLGRDGDGVLQVVVIEVHNTHGERHLYTLRPEAGNERGFVARMAKEFYVSPFIETRGGYAVRIRDDVSRLRITINHRLPDGLVLHASLDLDRRPLTDRRLLAMFARHPLITHRTLGMIHWHALRLWLRGARFHPHRAGSPMKPEVS